MLDKTMFRFPTCPSGAVLRSVCSADIGELRTPSGPLPALPPSVDHVMIVLNKGKSQHIISATYFPPRLGGEAYLTYFNNMRDFLLMNGYDKFTIVGDFNLPHIEWYNDGIQMKPSHEKLGPPHTYLFNFMSVFNCAQINISLKINLTDY